MRNVVALRRSDEVIELRLLCSVKDEDRAELDQAAREVTESGLDARLVTEAEAEAPVESACVQVLETLSRELHERGRVFEVARQGGGVGEALRLLHSPRVVAGGL